MRPVSSDKSYSILLPGPRPLIRIITNIIAVKARGEVFILCDDGGLPESGVLN